MSVQRMNPHLSIWHSWPEGCYVCPRGS